MTDAPAPQKPPESGPAPEWPEDGLLFPWSPRKSAYLRVAAFAGAAFALHLFGFYLFQVVYPVTARVEPVPSRIRLLDPGNTAVIALMRQVDDRLVFLRPASSGTGVRLDLADHSAQFRLSFAGQEPRFRRVSPPRQAESPGAGGAAEISAALPGGMPLFLPPTGNAGPLPALGPPPVALAPSSSGRSWRIAGALAERPLRQAASLDAALEAMASGPPVKLALAVDREGIPRLAFPVGGGEESRFDALVSAVREHLRFEARREAPDRESGWLEIGR